MLQRKRTPAARARASTPFRSPASSGESRWQWLSKSSSVGKGTTVDTGQEACFEASSPARSVVADNPRKDFRSYDPPPATVPAEAHAPRDWVFRLLRIA